MDWNQMIPEFDVFDLKKSLEFYVDLIGFKVIYDRQEDKFAFLQLENVQIMVQEIDKENNKSKERRISNGYHKINRTWTIEK